MTSGFDAISSAEFPELDADADLEARMVEVFDHVIRLEESENEPEFNLPLTTDAWTSHHSLACSSPLTPSSSEHATDESSQRQFSPSFSFDSFDSFDPQISFQLAQLAIMAPNSTTGAILQGLNLVHSPHANPQVSSDAQDLLSSAAYADLSQLDLWTNVAFASDEPYVPPSDLNSDDGEEKDGKSGDSAPTALSLKKKRDFLAKNPPNVQRQLLLPPNVGGNSQEDSQQQHASGSNPAPAAPATAATPLFPPTTPAAYDFGSILAMSGHQISPEVMNFNQLLFNPFSQAHSFHQFASFQQQPLAPLAPVPPAPTTTSTPTAPQSPHESTNPPPAKKPRSRKASTAVAGSQAVSSAIAASEQRPNPVSRSPSVSDPHDDASQFDETSADPSKPMTPGEDKRRRNTAASARFRAKKKEREHAMESRCKNLESKVGDLERECEALRRENGWLKGLVVGVTGGTGMPIAMPGGPGLPTIPPPQQTSTATTGSKRKRDSTTSEATS